MEFDYGALLLQAAGLFRRVMAWEVNMLGMQISLGGFVVFGFVVACIAMFIKELLHG